MIGPWIHALWKRGRKLSDIEYLSIKEFDGKLVTNTGQQADGATGNTATLTASSGKDLYLAKASVTLRADAAQAGVPLFEVTLVANGVIVDRCEATYQANSSNGPPFTPVNLKYDFTVQGIKVAATQTIVIDVVTSDASVDISGTLVGFEEITGDNPAIS